MTAPPIGGNGASGSDAVARAEARDLERVAQLKAAQIIEAELRGWAEPAELEASNGAGQQHAGAELAELEASRAAQGAGAGPRAEVEAEQHAAAELGAHDASPSSSASPSSNGSSAPALPLTPEHRADLASSGLTEHTIARAGLRSETRTPVLARMLNRRSYPRTCGACLVFPCFVPGRAEPIGYRVKPTHPRTERRKSKTRPIKYESPAKRDTLVYLPPSARAEGWLGDAGRPLHWTEGEKKSLALDQEGYACVGLTGVWCWRDDPHARATGEDRLHPTVREHVTIPGRVHVIAYDSDAAAKSDVMLAARRLAAVLLAAGAGAVHFVTPPADGAHKGIDDYYAAHGAAALGALLTTATPLELADPHKQRQRGGRPVITLDPDRLHVTIDLAIAELARDTGIFVRDAQLVRAIRVDASEADAQHARMAVGTPQIRPLARATIRERLARVAAFDRVRGHDENNNPLMAPAEPPLALAEAIAARGEWPGMRSITAVIETPSMRGDGTIICTPGYDPTSGYLYAPSREYPAIALEPTREDARAALAALREPWREFPVITEAARDVPIAAILTIVGRPAIAGPTPAFVFDASTRGSGKSLLAKAVSTIAQGREAAVMTWPPDENELEKVLGGYALRGASIVVFDNIVSTFGGAPLDKVLTAADRVELRVLSTNRVPQLPWRAVVIGTGNNIVLGGDTARRSLTCRLEPMIERPEDRVHTIGDLPAWCRAHHPRLVAAALTLLRAYVIAGRPAQPLGGWGSFEGFRDLVIGAIMWAGGPDLMACRPTLTTGDDPELGALRVLLTALPPLTVDDKGVLKGITAGALLTKLYSPERLRGDAPPDGCDALREALEVLAPPPRPGYPPTAQQLGHRLRRLTRRVIAIAGVEGAGVGSAGPGADAGPEDEARDTVIGGKRYHAIVKGGTPVKASARHLDRTSDRNGLAHWLVCEVPR